MTDPQPEVRDEFWRASGDLLSADPSSTSKRLIASDASPIACAEALAGACDRDGGSWGRSLSPDDAVDVLRLIDQADWQGWTSQQIVTGIATSHPLVVLEHLAGHSGMPMLLEGDVEGLAGVFDGHGEVLARWLVECATSRPSSSRESAVAIALADGLGVVTATALEELVPDLDENVLAHLLAVLEPLDGAPALSTWPQQRPALARALLRRARVLGARIFRSSAASLESAMSLCSYSWVNGFSDELQRAFDVTTARAEDEPDEELREMYERAKESIIAQSSRLAQRYGVDG